MLIRIQYLEYARSYYIRTLAFKVKGRTIISCLGHSGTCVFTVVLLGVLLGKLIMKCLVVTGDNFDFRHAPKGILSTRID